MTIERGSRNRKTDKNMYKNSLETQLEESKKIEKNDYGMEGRAPAITIFKWFRGKKMEQW